MVKRVSETSASPTFWVSRPADPAEVSVLENCSFSGHLASGHRDADQAVRAINPAGAARPADIPASVTLASYSVSDEKGRGDCHPSCSRMARCIRRLISRS
jgi:hypothetical protein